MILSENIAEVVFYRLPFELLLGGVKNVGELLNKIRRIGLFSDNPLIIQCTWKTQFKLQINFQYAIFLAILLLLEMTVGVLGFVFKDSIKTQATRGFQAFIIHYREDPDQQNLIDWIQEDWVSLSFWTPMWVGIVSYLSHDPLRFSHFFSLKCIRGGIFFKPRISLPWDIQLVVSHFVCWDVLRN